VFQNTSAAGEKRRSGAGVIHRKSRGPSNAGRGKLAILKLREDYMRKMGPDYSLQKFHDAFTYSIPAIRGR
jgi:hypothetical protein